MAGRRLYSPMRIWPRCEPGKYSAHLSSMGTAAAFSKRLKNLFKRKAAWLAASGRTRICLGGYCNKSAWFCFGTKTGVIIFTKRIKTSVLDSNFKIFEGESFQVILWVSAFLLLLLLFRTAQLPNKGKFIYQSSLQETVGSFSPLSINSFKISIVVSKLSHTDHFGKS